MAVQWVSSILSGLCQASVVVAMTVVMVRANSGY